MVKTPNNNILVERLKRQLSIAEENHLIRKNLPFESSHQAQIKINKKKYINFSSNDYLGLSSSRSIMRAFRRGVKQYSFGSGSSVVISGYCVEQQTLERQFAEFLNRDTAVFFNSGYLANLGVFSALSKRDDSILSDKLCHASIVDGISLSRAKHYRYLHNDIVHLEKRLCAAHGHRFIVSESVFSMEGHISPIAEIVSIAKKHQATLLVDDAHGIGVLGEDGGGICDHFSLSQEDVPCLIIPLGKALGGYGAIVAGKSGIIAAIIQWARSYRYTTALPAAIIKANLKALDLLKKENKRREKLQALIQYFITKAKTLTLPLLSDHSTTIKTFLIKCNKKAQAIQAYMFSKGFLVSSIRPPTVPCGTARIRISINYNHSKQSIEALLNHLKKAHEKY